MKTIQIHFPPKGPPTVTPDCETCLSEEMLVFAITSDNTFMNAVNLAFDGVDDKIFCCPDSDQNDRKHHCNVDLAEITDPTEQRAGVAWGIAIDHKSDLPKQLKYTISPYVLGVPYKEGEIDPFVIVTKRP